MQLRYRCIDYISTAAQHNALHCSSWRRDGKTTTATYRNADAVEYERIFRHVLLLYLNNIATTLQCLDIKTNYFSKHRIWEKLLVTG